jgi:hypothetical protein
LATVSDVPAGTRSEAKALVKTPRPRIEGTGATARHRGATVTEHQNAVKLCWLDGG